MWQIVARMHDGLDALCTAMHLTKSACAVDAVAKQPSCPLGNAYMHACVRCVAGVLGSLLKPAQQHEQQQQQLPQPQPQRCAAARTPGAAAHD